ncbi:hypothetical protein CDL12_04509 [Handroanthus impetiginosus]|uniref:DUF8040 domain-containing protein n=1 Tax=Handroanthus impetiginosus TaxID=429701 RepID=A0A2G9HZ29_9LAMI|nr:hypothetical protein CDL12_04509 [Handroanthus impetiginosus]
MISEMPDQYKHLREMVENNDQTCVHNLHKDSNSFLRLCYYVFIPENVLTLLLILPHHTKNRIVKHNFKWSRHTVSRYFFQTLKAIIKISGPLLVKPGPNEDECTTDLWRYFKHNFTDPCPMIEKLDLEQTGVLVDESNELVEIIESSYVWNVWKDNLAHDKYNA